MANNSEHWKVLLVDDDDLHRETMEDWLTEEGYQVIAVADGDLGDRADSRRHCSHRDGSENAPYRWTCHCSVMRKSMPHMLPSFL